MTRRYPGWQTGPDGSFVRQAASQTAGPAFMDLTGLQALDPPIWLLEPYVAKGGLIMLAAAANVGKTFVAVDWALKLASRGEPVLYLALEGIHGLRQRVSAWEEHNGAKAGNIHFGSPSFRVNLTDTRTVERLCDEIQRHGSFALVVIDNFGEAFPGDENDAKSVGLAMAALKRIQSTSHGAVLLLHNFGHGASRARGHSKLLDSHDTVIYLTPLADSPGGLRVSCGKERNAERFAPRSAQLESVGESRVVVYGPALAGGEEVTAALLASGQPMTVTELAEVTKLSRDTATRRLRKLVELGEVVEAGKRGNATTYAPGFTEVAA